MLRRPATWLVVANLVFWVVLLGVIVVVYLTPLFQPIPPDLGESDLLRERIGRIVTGAVTIIGLFFLGALGCGCVVGTLVWWKGDQDRREGTMLTRAWDELGDALPQGWIVEPPGRPNGAWQLRAYEPGAVATTGLSVREWTVIEQSQLEAMRELTRCLRDIAAGNVPS